jgi:hypothetical protein
MDRIAIHILVAAVSTQVSLVRPMAVVLGECRRHEQQADAKRNGEFSHSLLSLTLANFDTGESREYAGIWEFSAFSRGSQTLPRPQ